MSPSNEALERRRRLYQERVVRRLVIDRPGWVEALGWKTDDWNALGELQDTSVCRATHYEPPVVVPDDQVMRHPVAPLFDDWSLMQGLARLQIARREPDRQFELFGWRTPPATDLYWERAFEKHKEAYWSKVLAEPLEQMHVLKDTADFGANYLLRLFYLHAETPAPLQSARAKWRGDLGFKRDVNFSSTVEARIVERFLAFKFWLDAPFAASDPARPEDGKRIQAERQLLVDAGRFTSKELGAEMCYWSENHQVLFSTAEYLAGQLWPDKIFRAGQSFRPEGPDAVRPGDLTGRQHVEQARARLLRWLNDRLRFGFSEWNAPGYYEEDLAALFNLADFALDEEVRVRACMAIDIILFDMARLSHKGSFGVTGGRSHFKHKSCGFQQSVGDLAEVIFETRGAIVGATSGCAGSFASSTSYDVPEVLIRIARDQPAEMRDRRRVSIDPSEAALYGIGTTTEEDVLFWWSRGAFLIKEIATAADRVVRNRHLIRTSPFSATLPILRALAGLGVAGDIDDVANSFSVLTEGSALTQARLTTYRSRHAMLSSVRQFHQQQLSFQAQFCQATLSMGATVWATYPPSDSENLRDAATATGATVGVGAGAATGAKIGSIFGPIGTAVGGLAGAIAGGIGGGVGAHEALSDKDKAVTIFPTDPDGPDWWTGSATIPMVAQVDGAAILVFSPRAIQWWLFKSQTHAWFPKPAFDPGSVVQRRAPNSSEGDGRWTFGRVRDGYVGLYSARKPVWTTEGPWKDRELIAEGDGNVFIIQIGDMEQFGSYNSFIESVCKARINISDIGDDETQCSYDVPGGKRLELHLDGLQVRYGGPGMSSRFPRFESPYIEGGRVGNRVYRYTIAHAGHKLHHNFEQIKTHGERANVIREVDRQPRDRRDLAFLAIAHRGAMRVFAENSIEACRRSLDVEGANALAIDVCLTSDGHAIAWHDWDPTRTSAVLRRLGLVDSGRYKPIAPESGSPWLRPTIEISLAEFRVHYGYTPVDENDPAPPAHPVPTLKELIDALGGRPDLLQLIINVRLPGHLAETLGQAALRTIMNALPAAPTFRTTVLSRESSVVKAMQSGLSASGPRVDFCWQWTPPEVGGLVPEAISGAIELGVRVAAFRRPSSSPSEGWDVIQSVRADLWNWDAFNFNPRVNGGHQIDLVLAGTINDPIEQQLLVDEEISGLITDEIPQLVGIVRQAGLAR